MTVLHKRILLLSACAALVLGTGTCAVFAAQKNAKASSTKASAGNKTQATVDLNTASEKDLDSLPGVGPATAKKIVAGRPYSSVDDLSKAGVSARTIKKITPLVTVNGGMASRTKASTKTSKDAAPASGASPARSSAPAPAPPAKEATSSPSQGTAGRGMVWVNLDSGVYHYEGTRYYGKTKNGKYMSEADAVKAGYHAAKNEKKPQ